MGSAARANTAARVAQLQATIEALQQSVSPDAHQLIDAYGNPIGVGGGYAYIGTRPLVLTVTKIEVDRRPNAPPGQYLLSGYTQITLAGLSRAPMSGLIMVSPPVPLSMLTEELTKLGGSQPADPDPGTDAETPTPDQALIQLTDLQ